MRSAIKEKDPFIKRTLRHWPLVRNCPFLGFGKLLFIHGEPGGLRLLRAFHPGLTAPQRGHLSEKHTGKWETHGGLDPLYDVRKGLWDVTPIRSSETTGRVHVGAGGVIWAHARVPEWVEVTPGSEEWRPRADQSHVPDQNGAGECAEPEEMRSAQLRGTEGTGPPSRASAGH